MSKNKIFSFLIIGFLIGIFIAPLFPFNDLTLFITFLLLFFIALIFWKNPIVRLVAFFSIFFVFGFWRFYYTVPQVSEGFISFYNGKAVELEGFISSYPQEKDRIEAFNVSVSKIKIQNDWREVKGKVYILTSKLKDFEYGENIKLKGNLEGIDNEEEFNYASFFAAKGIYSRMKSPEVKKEQGISGNFVFSALFKLRKAFEEKNDQVFVEPFSSLVLGINLGVKRISQELVDIFNIVSISHIIVISGYNLSVVSDFFKKIFQGFSRRLSFWLPLSAIILFTIFVGAEPPVLRAAIMAGVLLLAKKKGRKASGVFVLLFAAFAMVILNPMLLRYDPGFQLSFLATLGLILISDKILNFLKQKRFPFVLSEALAATLAAQIFILPVIIYYFGRLSLVAPLANVLVLPAVPFIMFSSFIVTMIGFFSLGVARFLALVPSASISYLISTATNLSKVPFASLSLAKSSIFIYFYYSVLTLPYLLKGLRVAPTINRGQPEAEKDKNEKTAVTD